MTSSSPSGAGVASATPPPPAGRRAGAWGAILPSARAHARELARFATVAGELALLVGVIRVFDIENAAFQDVMTLVVGAFVVNHFLPPSWRLPFFASVSLFSIVIALDARSALWIVGLGGLLLGACHLPIAFGRRVALLCGLAVLLAGVRAKAWWTPSLLSDAVPGAIWPILGSMFMFRLIVYLYELRHRGAPFSFWRGVAYFFMVPNACFPLFPVVDYKAFCRGHYGDEPYRIYRVGLRWILRGVVHLVLYRLVYQNFVIEPSAAANLRDVAQYMLATFLLYLKVSGTFHVIVGTLRLFGFDLPETHHLYLLASGFTDFWRRINIYWKDFIQNLVFYPLYFRLRGFGRKRATILATLLAFAATWLLHSYQWFWIRGSFPITWTDAVFWLGLGVAVVAGVARELRPGRSREAGSPGRATPSRLGLALRTAGTFTAICLLWTIWSTTSGLELQELLAAARVASLADVLLVLLVPATIGLLAVLLERRPRPRPAAASPAGTRGVLGSSLPAAAACVLLIAVGSETAWSWLGLALPAKVAAVKRNKLNDWDVKALERGYYEDLGDPTRFNSNLLELYRGRPAGWQTNPAARGRSDVLLFELLPSRRVTFKGAVLTTSSMGLRDREYTVEKPPGTFRAVLLGASHEMGAGVGDDETYENLVEDRLNRDAASAGRRYEILNFSVGGHAAVQKLAMLEQRAFAFDPDLVLFVVHSGEFDATARRLATVVAQGGEIPYEPLRRLVESARVGRGDPPEQIASRLSPIGRDMVRWVFQRLSEQCRSRGTEAAVMLLEKPEELEDPRGLEELRRMANESGMEVLDLRGAFAGVPSRRSLWIAKWDDHPNPEGHRLLANRFYQALIASDALRGPSVPALARLSR